MFYWIQSPNSLRFYTEKEERLIELMALARSSDHPRTISPKPLKRKKKITKR